MGLPVQGWELQPHDAKYQRAPRLGQLCTIEALAVFCPAPFISAACLEKGIVGVCMQSPTRALAL
jgi:hypothetical protein